MNVASNASGGDPGPTEPRPPHEPEIRLDGHHHPNRASSTDQPDILPGVRRPGQVPINRTYFPRRPAGSGPSSAYRSTGHTSGRLTPAAAPRRPRVPMNRTYPGRLTAPLPTPPLTDEPDILSRGAADGIATDEP